MPFSVGSHSDLATVPLPEAFRLIPRDRRGVLVMHYYRHFTTYSVQVYRQRVQEARRTVQELLDQYPHVQVLVRGVHTAYDVLGNKVLMIGDNSALWYNSIWKEEFAGLRDRVRYLDYWDLTVAAENIPSHPDHPYAMEMIKTLFGYICDVKM